MGGTRVAGGTHSTDEETGLFGFDWKRFSLQFISETHENTKFRQACLPGKAASKASCYSWSYGWFSLMTDTCHTWGSTSSEDGAGLEDRGGLQKPQGWGWDEGDEQVENRATPTRRHLWEQPANTVRGWHQPHRACPWAWEDRATQGLTPEDQGVSAQTTGLPLPLSQALPRAEGNCVSFIHLFIKDPASGIVSNRWNSGMNEFLYRKPAVPVTSWDILGNKPITSLDTSSIFTKGRREDRILIPAPIPLPLSLSVLRRSKL